MNFIKKIIIYILANAVALYFIAESLNGSFIIYGSYKGYIITAIIFGILNSIIKPILKLLSLPFILLTAGIFTIFINVFLAWFAKYSLDILLFDNVSIVVKNGIITYLYVGVAMAIINVIITWLLKK